jgi:hypothetical protein
MARPIPQKLSVRIVSVPTEIRTKYFQVTRQAIFHGAESLNIVLQIDKKVPNFYVILKRPREKRRQDSGVLTETRTWDLQNVCQQGNGLTYY